MLLKISAAALRITFTKTPQPAEMESAEGGWNGGGLSDHNYFFPQFQLKPVNKGSVGVLLVSRSWFAHIFVLKT